MADYNIVKKYWELTAEKLGTDPRATIKDHQFRLLEIDTIKNYLTENDVVIDIGCGNGYSTLEYAKIVKEITGIDYSKNMIKFANEASKKIKGKNNFEFKIGDILNIELPENYYHVAISERCLINLPSNMDQERAVLNIYKSLKMGGKFIIAEVTLEGHRKINALRELFGLDKIKVHWHNVYIKEEEFLPFLLKYFKLLETKRFGMYQFLSKIVHPLLVEPEEPKFEAKINEI